MCSAIVIETKEELNWQKILGGGESWVYLFDSAGKLYAAWKRD